jgi:hypothetical protein
MHLALLERADLLVSNDTGPVHLPRRVRARRCDASGPSAGPDSTWLSA